MEIFIVIAALILVWFAWQLHRAKQFNKFKSYIFNELKPKVVAHIQQELEQTRSDLLPNNACHQQATIDYWSCCAGRILQAALIREIVTEEELKQAGNYRHCQHLFHIEQDKLHH